MNKLATNLLEDTISYVGPRQDVRDLSDPDPGCWTVDYPSVESLFTDDIAQIPEGKRVAIATEDIVGPIRNGGIGTTYSFLSRLLANAGISVSILYLRGNHTENEPIEYWVDYYAQMGVDFVPVPDVFSDEHKNPNASRWLAPMYNMYRFLRDNPFDLVHVSEWRGSGYMSMLAKKQGLCFQDTQFLVKCSSPWLWNRMYGNHTIKESIDVMKIYCERRSIEMADHVIGGSAHLIRWMSSQGYEIPKNKTFVQPNVLLTDDLEAIAADRNLIAGQIVDVSEIVFFGRLEERKGLQVFCEAIERLVSIGVELPPISFMGKVGARLNSRPELPILDYIQEKSSKWGVEIQVHTGFQQKEALTYLMSESRLAVMPSLIENSSLAVYEAVICGVPFLSSNSGGTPELVKKEYHDRVLFDPHPVTLSERLQSVLENGAVVAECTFSNDNNNRIWLEYHKQMLSGTALSAVGKTESIEEKTDIQSKRSEQHDITLGVLVYHNDDLDVLERTIDSLLDGLDSSAEVIVLDDSVYGIYSDAFAAAELQRKLQMNQWRVIPVGGYDRGIAYNKGAAELESSHVAFLRSGDTLSNDFMSVVLNAISESNARMFTTYYRHHAISDDGSVVNLRLETPVLGDIPTSFYAANLFDYPLICDKNIVEEIGGFTGDYRVGAEIQEFVNSGLMHGIGAEAIPEVLMSREQSKLVQSNAFDYNRKAEEARSIRPFYQHGPQVFRNLFLVARGQADQVDVLNTRLNWVRIDRDKQRKLKEKYLASSREHKEQLDLLKKSDQYKASKNKILSFASKRSQSALYRSKWTEQANESAKNIVSVFGDTDALDGLKIALTDSLEGGVVFANADEVVVWISGASRKKGARVSLYCNDDCVSSLAVADGEVPASHLNKIENKQSLLYRFNISGKFDEETRKSALFRVMSSEGYVLHAFEYDDNRLKGVRGAIDDFNLNRCSIRGWLWNATTPNEVLVADVFWDGEYLQSADCDHFQGWRMVEGKPAPYVDNGFTLELPKTIIDGEWHDIEVRLATSDICVSWCKARVNTATGEFVPNRDLESV